MIGTPFYLRPEAFCVGDVSGLAAFVAAAKQNIDHSSRAGVVHAVASTDVHTHFADAFTYGFSIAKISLCCTG